MQRVAVGGFDGETTAMRRAIIDARRESGR
jgi:hypothetical protein